MIRLVFKIAKEQFFLIPHHKELCPVIVSYNEFAGTPMEAPLDGFLSLSVTHMHTRVCVYRENLEDLLPSLSTAAE
jgi:hypothetical protein